jgi:hypothetical protein
METQMMILDGWTHPLPTWLEDAVIKGLVVVYEAKEGYQYLVGTVTNPFGTVVCFNWPPKVLK